MANSKNLYARAAKELAAAQTALNRADLIFTLIDNCAALDSKIKILAGIGAEIAAPAAERAEAESEFFAEVNHD